MSSLWQAARVMRRTKSVKRCQSDILNRGDMRDRGDKCGSETIAVKGASRVDLQGYKGLLQNGS